MFQLVIDVQKEEGAGGVGTLKDGGEIPQEGRRGLIRAP